MPYRQRFEKTAVEIWAWMSSYILLFYVDVITHSFPDKSSCWFN